MSRYLISTILASLLLTNLPLQAMDISEDPPTQQKRKEQPSSGSDDEEPDAKRQKTNATQEKIEEEDTDDFEEDLQTGDTLYRKALETADFSRKKELYLKASQAYGREGNRLKSAYSWLDVAYNAQAFLEKGQYFAIAGTLFEIVGKKGHAAHAYKHAARNTLGKNKKEYGLKSAVLYEETEKFLKAAKAYQEVALHLDNTLQEREQNNTKAKDLYKKGEKKWLAAERCEHIAAFTPALKDKKKALKEGAQLYEEADDKTKAVNLYCELLFMASDSQEGKEYLLKCIHLLQNPEQSKARQKRLAEIYGQLVLCTHDQKEKKGYALQSAGLYERLENRRADILKVYNNLLYLCEDNKEKEKYLLKIKELVELENKKNEYLWVYEYLAMLNPQAEGEEDKKNLLIIVAALEEAGEKLQTAKAYEGAAFRTNDIHESKQYHLNAAKLYEAGGKPLKAARSYLHISLKTINMAEQKECYLKRAKIYENNLDFSNAADIWLNVAKNTFDQKEKKDAFIKAAESFQKAQNKIRAAKALKKAATFTETSQEKRELYTKTVALLGDEIKSFDIAAMTHLLLSNNAQNPQERKNALSIATSLYESAGNYEKAASAMYTLGMDAACYNYSKERSEDFLKVALLYTLAKDKGGAARSYKHAAIYASPEDTAKKINFLKTASFYEELGKKKNAAQAYAFAAYFGLPGSAEQKQDYAKAAKLYEEAGFPERAQTITQNRGLE